MRILVLHVIELLAIMASVVAVDAWLRRSPE